MRGRRPLGHQAMTDAERQQKRRDKLHDDPVGAIVELAKKLNPEQRAQLLAEIEALPVMA
jgi:hypothetical protein